MEGQAVPRLQPLSMHHLNKGRHHSQNVGSPPLSPTAATAPTSNTETAKVKPLNAIAPNAKASQNGAEAQKRGWLSFDDSPVHNQPAAGNNFVSTQSPWMAATGEKQWTPFADSGAKQEVKPAVQKPRIPPIDVPPTVARAPPVSSTPVKPPQSVPGYHSTPSALPNSQHDFTAKQNLTEASVPQYQAADVRHRRRVASKEDEVGHAEPHDGSSDFQDPWCINVEQRDYYTKQFATMQPDLEGKINGQSARNFFTKSKLPILELSHIWELSDMDQDGHLTLDEFCTAFHLVVARKNGYELPPQLPQALVPTLIDITGESEKNVADTGILEVKRQQSTNHMVTSPKGNELKQEQWETFSDRTSSSTTLANFDQVLDSTTEHLHHPVAVRMTPSRHHEHWTRVGESGGDTAESQAKAETVDEESTTSSPQTRTKVVTNPYGYLRNEPDSAGEDLEIKPTRLSSSSDSTTNALEAASDKSYKRHKARGRSHSNSSLSSTTSSVATSERSSDEDHFHERQVRSDPEHSDWSSRPLRPRSGSSSSLESGSVPMVTAPPPPVAAAPTPPPRPQVHAQHHAASPIPKPRPVPTKTTSSDSKLKPPTKEQEARADGPTPPPRPQQTANQESFADFSNFNQASQPDESNAAKTAAAPAAAKSVEKRQQQTEKLKTETQAAKDQTEKPVPAPRPQKENLKSNETSENETRETESDKTLQGKKAPAKPPRSRMLSADVCKPEPILTPLTVKSNEEAKIADPPKQEAKREKTQLQSAIRELKNRNTQLTRLNGDLQQQLKDVMEKRITVEMTIHQMRPFTQ